MNKKHSPPDAASLVIDQYIDLLVQREQEIYTSKLESFESYKEKFRQKASHALHQFKNDFFRGYQTLIAELEPTTKNIQPFLISETALESLNSLEKITAFLDKGSSLYELFGYSDEVLATFYKTAHKIVEERRFKEGYDAYFFIVTIAPHIREAWLNIGYTLCQLGEPLTGIEANARAFELDPTNPDSYLATAGAYKKHGDIAKSHETCDVGIKLAELHKDADWAPELMTRAYKTQNAIYTKLEDKLWSHHSLFNLSQ